MRLPLVKAILAITAATISLCPASAREWAAAGGWDIYEEDDYCFMVSEFEGPGDTDFAVAVTSDGLPILTIHNTEWSIEAKKSYKLMVDMEGLAVHGQAMGLKGQSYPYKNGLVAKIYVDKFLDAFAKSPYIHLYLDNTSGEKFNSEGAITLDRLELDGSAVAIAQVRRCAAEVKREKDAAARAKAEYEAKWRHIPKDPFASPESRKE